MLASGDTVSYAGGTYTVQYVNSKGNLDLKDSASGEVAYGVAPDQVALALRWGWFRGS